MEHKGLILKYCRALADTCPVTGADEITAWRTALSTMHSIELAFLPDAAALGRHLGHCIDLTEELSPTVKASLGSPPHQVSEINAIRNALVAAIQSKAED
jgi:hypothetical protein